MNPPEPHVLDNPIWHALTGPHAPLARVYGPLRAYPPDMAPFSAFGEGGDALWSALDDFRRPVVLFRPQVEPAPTGWALAHTGEVVQMVLPADVSLPEAGPRITRLGSPDEAEARALVALTRPGPFEARTMSLGAYFGVREGEQLVALAGERLRLSGYTKVSAVCTHPRSRGRGLAGLLVTHLARRAREQGAAPFLHVMANNERARRVYERLGFVTRAHLHLSVWAHPG